MELNQNGVEWIDPMNIEMKKYIQEGKTSSVKKAFKLTPPNTLFTFNIWRHANFYYHRRCFKLFSEMLIIEYLDIFADQIADVGGKSCDGRQ